MNARLEQLKALANEDVEASGIDMNEAVKGGGGGRLLPVGYAFGRLVEYIELGMQPQEYGGVAKEPALEFSLGFALWGQGYQNEDGTPYVLRPYSKALSRNEKSGAFKMFKCLNWKGTAKGYAQLLGETFLVKIVHKAKSKTDPTIVSRIDELGFLPPLDPVTKAPYPIPEAADDLYRLFLWNRPTKDAWNSLFIEGTWEAKDGKPAQTKNRVQEQILAAVDFNGSPLQQLLMASGVTSLPNAPATPATTAQVAVLPASPVVPATPAAVATAAAPVAAPLQAPVIAALPPAVPAGPAVPATPAAPLPVLPSSPVLPV